MLPKRFPQIRLNRIRSRFLAGIVLLCNLALSGCASLSTSSNPALQEPTPHPIRFLLTFDDGPSAADYLNPTETVLESLARNPVQPGIKALFFVQTRGPTLHSPGRELLPREYTEGHLIGLHTATDGHRNHRFLPPAEFIASLENGIADIRTATGVAPTLIRPPFWSYDARTYAGYQAHGLHMLLTDLSANDGVIWGFNGSLRKHSNLYNQLAAVRPQIAAGTLPVVDGAIPVVVTFHDINSYTARHLVDYLQILIEVAKELNMPTASLPFYTDRDAVERAAHARSVRSEAEQVNLPGIWNWLWRQDQHAHTAQTVTSAAIQPSGGNP